MWKDRKHETVITCDSLAEYLVETGQLKSVEEYNERVTKRINEIMRLMFLQIRDKLDRKFGCYEVFGFDFMLDDKLNPYFLEVNMNPAMFLDTKTMADLLPKLVNDACNLAVEIHKDHKKQSETQLIHDLVKNQCQLPYEVLYEEVDLCSSKKFEPEEVFKVETA